MLELIASIIIVFGFSFTLWGLVGLARFLFEFIAKIIYLRKNGNGRSITESSSNLVENYTPTINQVAVVMPARNEELVIAESLEAIKRIIPAKNIFVGNDGSQDKTSELVKIHGANVLDIYPNRGKAGVMVAVLNHFNIYQRYKYVIFVDADTRLRHDYLSNALPLFKDEKIAAVAGYAKSQWKNNIFIAYRSRLWLIIQIFFRYGMSWKYTNVNMIVPGFASIYRTNILKQIDIAKPNLIIEDFNMTFELQKKRLGKIAHHRSITGYTQDPDMFSSYCNQIKRWNLGFWQTIRANGIWPSAFWFNMIIYLVEIALVSTIFLFLPLLVIFALSIIAINSFMILSTELLSSAYLILQWFLVLLTLDYLYSLIAAIVDNRPQLLFYGPAMIFFRCIDAYYLFVGFFLTYITKSNGAWTSPERWKQSKQISAAY